jgi:hypothetical protein
MDGRQRDVSVLRPLRNAARKKDFDRIRSPAAQCDLTVRLKLFVMKISSAYAGPMRLSDRTASPKP